jgi:transposase
MSDAVCSNPGCLARDALLAQLQQRVAELEATVRQLQERLQTNSTNSSLPPSANPLHAPPPAPRKKSKRQRGAQLGHPPHLRQLLPPERVTDPVAFVPTHCAGCRAPLPQQPQPDDPPPTRHQVVEVPDLKAKVTEYQGHARTCPVCRHVTHAAIPAELKRSCVGPQLTATLGYLMGAHHLSKRGVEEFVEVVFEVPLSLGTVCRLQEQLSAALAGPHAEVLQAVQAATVKHADETSWKRRGKRCWLWLAATHELAAFVLQKGRGIAQMVKLLGRRLVGLLVSDRLASYLPMGLERQLCWAHLRRDFQKLLDRGGASQPLGQRLLALAEQVFEKWYHFRGGGCTRWELFVAIVPLEKAVGAALREGLGCGESKTEHFCANVLALESCLWMFVRKAGVEPTNNHAERLLRGAVLWRKKSFGCQSESGCRFVERILTAVQTLRLQKRPLLAFLGEAITAHRNNLPAPSLLPTG